MTKTRSIKILQYFTGLILFAISMVSGFSVQAQSSHGVKILDSKARAALALRLVTGTGIHIVEYHKDIDAYVVQIEGEEAVGPNTTTLDWLLKAIDNGMSQKDLAKNPNKLLGTYYRIKNELWLLSNEEIAERKAEIAKKKNKP